METRAEFERLLAIHGSDKDESVEEIGEKGIGLKFAIFSCNLFRLESTSSSGSVRGHIKGARHWLKSKSAEIPVFDYQAFTQSKNGSAETGTRVVLEDVEVDTGEGTDSIFAHGTTKLLSLLRTRTAIGNTNLVFGKDKPIRVTLEHQPPDGKKIDTEVPFRYLLPTELLEDSDVLDYDEYVRVAAHLSDQQKTNLLRDKTIVISGKQDKAGRQMRYFFCFLPNRPLWTELRRRITPDATEDDSDDQHFIGPGIFVATKGMPTGIQLSPPVTGYQGYWANIFLLIQDDALSFDLGRKWIPGRTQGVLKEMSHELFNKISRIAPLISGASHSRQGPGALYAQERAQMFQKLSNLTDLKVPGIGFQKYPDGQEAGVVAIFHELVGAGHLPQFKSLRQGYRGQYDLWARYLVRHSEANAEVKKRVADNTTFDIVVEFKFSAEAVIKDAAINTKFFEDIDLIVCWDLDEAAFAKSGIRVEAVPAPKRVFAGASYNLVWPGSFNLGAASTKPVLALRHFVEELVMKPKGK